MIAQASRLHELVGWWARQTPEAPALVFEGTTLTFDGLATLIDSWRERVSNLTAARDRVAVLCDNRPDMVALLYAVPAAGRTLVPLNTRHAATEVRDQIHRSGARLLVGTSELLAAVREGLAASVAVVDLDEPAGSSDATPGAGGSALSTPTGPSADSPSTPAWIIFTSGSTGRPKGVLLTDASLLAAVRATAAGRPLADDDVYLYPFPLFHVSAYNVLHAHARGRPVVLLPRFRADEVVALTAEHSVTAMSLAPTMLRMLLDHIDSRPDARLSSLRSIAYGAAPMPAPLLEEGVRVLRCEFAQGYGMTELSGNAVFLSPDDHRAALAGDARMMRAAGRAAPGVEIRTVDDHGADVSPGEAGEIWVRAEQVCGGYLDDPDATAAAIGDGWLHTGDVGTLAPDGLLTIVDRAKDVVVTGGENVASREVEAALLSHPLVAQVAVIGLPDDRWGEAVSAVIVTQAEADLGDLPGLEADLSRHVGERLAGYKKPRRVFVVNELPVNAGGKVDKPALRRRFGNS